MKKILFIITLLVLGMFAGCHWVDDNEVEVSQVVLSSDKHIIQGNGSDNCWFSTIVYEDTEHIYGVNVNLYKDGKYYPSYEFSSLTAGTYDFYAVADGVKSNILTITVNEVTAKPNYISISANKSTIIANNNDYADFTVTAFDYNGNLIQGLNYTLYKNKFSYNSTIFKTNNSGEYEFYAIIDGVKSNTVYINAVYVNTETTTLTIHNKSNYDLLLPSWYDYSNIEYKFSNSYIYLENDNVNTLAPGEHKTINVESGSSEVYFFLYKEGSLYHYKTKTKVNVSNYQDANFYYTDSIEIVRIIDQDNSKALKK